MDTTDTPTKSDLIYLARAIKLARKGRYTTGLNPRVGCVVVKDGEIIGEGWHKIFGEAHAEVNALNSIPVGKSAESSVVYVSMEPCSHEGKTGPCANALITAGVKRVVCAMEDPAAHVSGTGINMLRDAGIEVVCGLMQSEAEALNLGFVKRAKTGKPYIRIKMAASLDGRTAMASGESQWITQEPARIDVQQWRARSDLIISGIGTVEEDDPRLSIRPDQTWAEQWPADIAVKQVPRLIVDSHLRISPEAQVLREIVNGDRVIIVCAKGDIEKEAILKSKGAEVWKLPGSGKVDLSKLMHKLGEEQFNEVWVESGSRLAGAFLQAGLFDELIVYTASTVLGSNAKALFTTQDIDKMDQKISLQLKDLRKVGEDVRSIYIASEKR